MATAKKTEFFTLTLSREEALALVLLSRSAVGVSFVRHNLDGVALALEDTDASLVDEQIVKYREIGAPTYDLGDES